MADYTYIFFDCPICRNILKIPESYTGTQGCCPFYEQIINAPEDQKSVIGIAVDKNETYKHIE